MIIKNDLVYNLVQNEMLEEGHEYAVMLYTWRSCSRAIPQVTQTSHMLTHLGMQATFHQLGLKVPLCTHLCLLLPHLSCVYLEICWISVISLSHLYKQHPLHLLHTEP